MNQNHSVSNKTESTNSNSINNIDQCNLLFGKAIQYAQNDELENAIVLINEIMEGCCKSSIIKSWDWFYNQLTITSGEIEFLIKDMLTD